MHAGEFLSGSDRLTIERMVRRCEEETGFHYSVWIGESHEDSRAHAEKLHGRLANPANSILMAIDPVSRLLEIVTGSEVRRFVRDSEVALASIAMQTSFAGGDFAGGIVQGLQQIGEHARRPRTWHLDRGNQQHYA